MADGLLVFIGTGAFVSAALVSIPLTGGLVFISADAGAFVSEVVPDSVELEHPARTSVPATMMIETMVFMTIGWIAP